MKRPSHPTWLELNALVNRIQGALGTEEWGDDLVEVARNAYKAEQELAAIQHKQWPGKW